MLGCLLLTEYTCAHCSGESCLLVEAYECDSREYEHHENLGASQPILSSALVWIITIYLLVSTIFISPVFRQVIVYTICRETGLFRSQLFK